MLTSNNLHKFTLASLATFLQAELRGRADYEITGIASLDSASPTQISFLEKPVFKKYLATTRAGAVIMTAKDAEQYFGNCLIVVNPYLSYAKLTSLFKQIPQPKIGVHPKAVIGEDCEINNSAHIANCTLGNNVKIGANTIIESGCVIGDEVVIGDDCHIYPNVTIYYRVSLGNQVVIHSGTVLGADGFGMANDRGRWCKIYQLGSVKIGNDVEIGANTCIDRGALNDTVIEDGVKLDNLVQIGHNVKIGVNTAVAGCVGIAGSTTIGKNCMIGGAAMISGHIQIADGTIITGAATVGRSIREAGIYSSGINAQPHQKWLQTLANLVRLNRLIKKIGYLEEKTDE